jgi:hypothetical protein
LHIHAEEDCFKAEKHIGKVAGVLLCVAQERKPIGATWIRDINDAMRCIDHLPIS